MEDSTRNEFLPGKSNINPLSTTETFEIMIGTWARNRIGVVSKKSDIPKDYKEITFDLVER